jgi:hypothetical protein
MSRKDVLSQVFRDEEKGIIPGRRPLQILDDLCYHTRQATGYKAQPLQDRSGVDRAAGAYGGRLPAD